MGGGGLDGCENFDERGNWLCCVFKWLLESHVITPYQILAKIFLPNEDDS